MICCDEVDGYLGGEKEEAFGDEEMSVSILYLGINRGSGGTSKKGEERRDLLSSYSPQCCKKICNGNDHYN